MIPLPDSVNSRIAKMAPFLAQTTIQRDGTLFELSKSKALSLTHGALQYKLLYLLPIPLHLFFLTHECTAFSR